MLASNAARAYKSKQASYTRFWSYLRAEVPGVASKGPMKLAPRLGQCISYEWARCTCSEANKGIGGTKVANDQSLCILTKSLLQ